MLNKLITLLFVLISAYASGFELDDLKKQGLVGEQPDGYLGIVDDNIGQYKPYKSIQEKINVINLEREKHYKKIARKNDIELNQVERIFGKEILKKTQERGGYIKLENKWEKLTGQGFD